MHLLLRLDAALLAQRGHLLGWVPVCLALGVGGYFALPVEPGLTVWAAGLVTAVACLILVRVLPLSLGPLFIALALVLSGAGIAKIRTEMVAGPQLEFRYYGPISGRVVDIDRSASDAVRLTLDRVWLDRVSPARTPHRVRVSLHGDQPLARVGPGDHLMMTGHLSPPAGPAEPGGFDFQRHAWFERLGAVGYTRTPALRFAPAQREGLAQTIFRTRMAISRAVQAEIGGEAGAFAAAIMTGDRSGIGQDSLTYLRASNLAHLLAISGLHMGLLTGVIFAAIRFGFAAIPYLALRLPAKKIAAVAAILAGFCYLLLSGGNVATERAFIMVSVMFVAVLLDLRAITLRAVALAAILVLLLRPEALTGPGFQMSFAATTALVVVFGQMRKLDLHKLPNWTRPVLSVVVSSAVAGLATAPIAAAHFNQFAHYGLIANLLSVPLMGVLVMPAAVLAVCLAPFGLWSLGLWLVEAGLRWILWVAETVATTNGALSHIIAPQPVVLPVLCVAALWLILWRGHARWLGAGGMVAAFVLWAMTERPVVLVADSGALIGRLTDDGRALSKPRGAGFVAGIWLENDGAPVAQSIAAEREGIRRAGRVVQTRLGDWQIVQVSGKTALAEMSGCASADVLISNQLDAGPRPCVVFDLRRLRATGALALSLNDNGALEVRTARGTAGVRPWNAGAGAETGLPAVLTLEKGTALAAAQ